MNISKSNEKEMTEPASITTVKKADATCTVICGDSRSELGAYAGQADLLVTSPPYADARRKHYDSVHPDEFVEWFLSFHEPFFNALKPTGSLVLNIKDKVVDGVRHRYVWQTVEALCQRGWFAIDDYIWHKTNPMPGYWPTRLRDGWEYCFHLAKSKRPFFNPDAVRKPIGNWVETRLNKLGQNDLSRHNSVNDSGFGRDISKWVGKETVLPSNVVSVDASAEDEFTPSDDEKHSNVISRALVGKNKGHPAVFPVDLPMFFIGLLCPDDGLVIDPFGGSGTTGVAALMLKRRSILIDNNAKYCQEAIRRLQSEVDARYDEGIVQQNLY
ncbi:MAG TPA: site-specific DNA-methyltransferase [Pyrinomonadaceae bacterium]